MAEDFRTPIYPTDCDIVGHVNHAKFLVILEQARWHALLGSMSYQDYARSGLWAVVRHVEISYESQAFPGDEVVVRTGLVSVGNTSFIVRQQARNASGTLLCEAKIVYVTVSRESKPIPVPDEWRKLFAEWTDPVQGT